MQQMNTFKRLFGKFPVTYLKPYSGDWKGNELDTHYLDDEKMMAYHAWSNMYYRSPWYAKIILQLMGRTYMDIIYTDLRSQRIKYQRRSKEGIFPFPDDVITLGFPQFSRKGPKATVSDN